MKKSLCKGTKVKVWGNGGRHPSGNSFDLYFYGDLAIVECDLGPGKLPDKDHQIVLYVSRWNKTVTVHQRQIELIKKKRKKKV